MKDTHLRTSLLAACLAAGCATTTPGPAPLDHPSMRPYLHVYRGSFDSALTEDPGDDLNYNPCSPGDGNDCSTHREPLAHILLALRRRTDAGVSLSFYRTTDDLAAGRPLDLLGEGCGTRLGPLEGVNRTSDGALEARFPLTAENRLCLGKLRPVSRHEVKLVLEGADQDAPVVRVVIDKAVRDTNYLYVVENGTRRRVRIDLDNTVHENHQTRYRVCIENDLGEYDRCVLTDRTFKSFVLPVPLPGGGVGVNYTWWQQLQPDLHSTRGRYVVEQYIGRFDRISAEPPSGDRGSGR